MGDARRTRLLAAVRRRRLERDARKLRRLIERGWQNVADPPSRLILAARALGSLVVDEWSAIAYVKVRLASQEPHLDPVIRKHLKALLRPGLEAIRHGARLSSVRGRKQKLSPGQAQQAYRAYCALLRWFQDPANRPGPERSEDQALLRKINQTIDQFPPGRHITLQEMSFKLTEEAEANRLAKVTVGLAFGVSAGQVEKIISRFRARPPHSPAGH